MIDKSFTKDMRDMLPRQLSDNKNKYVAQPSIKPLGSCTSTGGQGSHSRAFGGMEADYEMINPSMTLEQPMTVLGASVSSTPLRVPVTLADGTTDPAAYAEVFQYDAIVFKDANGVIGKMDLSNLSPNSTSSPKDKSPILVTEA